MRGSPLLAAFATIGVAACTSVGPVSAPIHSIKVSGDYRVVADCAFRQLAPHWIGLNKADLSSIKTVEIRSQDQQLTIWVIEFKDLSAGKTEIAFRTFRTIYGDDFWGEKIYRQMASCAPRIR